MMMKIEALIQPFKLDEVTAALEAIGVEEFSVSDVLKRGGRGARTAVYRGAEYRVATPMIKLEILASQERAQEVVRVFSNTARTNRWVDDGTILTFELKDAMRIRTGASLEFAVPS
jgi:nitrogen regulatory protein P-II 1